MSYRNFLWALMELCARRPARPNEGRGYVYDINHETICLFRMVCAKTGIF